MASLTFENVYIKDYYTLVGPKELCSKLTDYDMTIKDMYFGTKTFELAEIKMQQCVIDNLLAKNYLTEKDVNYLVGGDLINQISISSNCARNYKIPFIGIYSACATFVESLIIGSNIIESKNANNIICITSSHNLTAERQFRYPIEYGNFKPKTNTFTATASVGALLTNVPTKIKIKKATFGKVVDLGVNDVSHMGAVMAPACADTLHEHLKNYKEDSKTFDLILTGDLGCVGLDILKEYYYTVYHEKIDNIMDAGCQIYFDDDISGASGPCCLPLIFFTKIIKNKRYKKILLLGTGSLHNTVMVNQHQTIPSISHAIEIEVL